MKISELIMKLQQIQAIEGDLDAFKVEDEGIYIDRDVSPIVGHRLAKCTDKAWFDFFDENEKGEKICLI